jgi:hypothetical protein
MKAVLVQPPFVQLNAPYPAVHFLEAFLRGRGIEAVAFDHSIALYRRIFSREGLGKVFAGARAAQSCGAARGAGVGGVAGQLLPDTATAAQIERYLSYEPLYIDWIDGIVDFLSGGDPAMAHRLAAAAELPRGARTEAFLEARGGRIDPDEARALATGILDDLGDFIAYTLDPAFGTVRYAERLASSRADFGEVRTALESSWMVREFYAPMLDEFWTTCAKSEGGAPDLILVTIPFPGCLIGALACAQSARKAFGKYEKGARDGLGIIPGLYGTAYHESGDDGQRLYGTIYRANGGDGNRKPRIVFGGGYVSTELRGLRDVGIFDFCDYLSFDAGYGSLASIVARKDARVECGAGEIGDLGEGEEDGSGKRGDPSLYGTAYRGEGKSDKGLYRTMYRAKGGALVVSGFPAGDSAREEAGAARAVVDCAGAEEFARLEREAVTTIFPDYRSADFGSYLRIVDSGNAMHRLWSEAPWLKYSLAHGCYWKRCFFCDTELEYVADFARSSTEALVAAADTAAERTGLYGIHFVDEAMPMAALLDFARANRGRVRPFSFWGNVRFDASWTQGRCEFLAASGLVAVSGGIEIATERGLEMTGKGFDLASLVRTLVAMRRAGLLVHTYLIYGFPGQPAADIADSAEFCRQLFASGLVDSAFWHRFVLTRHSRMYREWKDGGRPGLKPVDRAWSFANNDLSFEGEGAFDRFDAPLAASLDAWMEGVDLERPLSAWFGRSAPKAAIGRDFVESLIASAEESLDEVPPDPKGKAYWIAGAPAAKASGSKEGGSRLVWAYRGELRSVELPGSEVAAAQEVAALLSSPRLGTEGRPYAALEAELALPRPVMAELLSAGLVVV